MEVDELVPLVGGRVLLRIDDAGTDAGSSPTVFDDGDVARERRSARDD